MQGTVFSHHFPVGVSAAQIQASLDEFNAAERRAARPPLTIEDGVLIFPETRCLFEDGLARIAAAFTESIDRIPAANKPSAVLLVGDFAESSVVALSARCRTAGIRVRLTTLPSAWDAVIKGAAISAFRSLPLAVADVRH